MGDPNSAALMESSGKRIELITTDLEKLKSLNAPLKAPCVPPISLLQLPFEIRRQIYHYCIPRKHVIKVSDPYIYIESPYEVVGLDGDYAYLGWNRNRNRNSIFLLSRQISGEALDILYGENTFKLSLNAEGEVYLKKNFTEENRQRMRYLLLIALPRGVSYRPETMPDSLLWSSILPSLKGLRIVAEQPVEVLRRLYYGAPTLEQEMECWVKWITPFLRCFDQHLSRNTIVGVDVDGRAETRKIVQESLSHGCREIRCRLVGDLIFKRGQFSWESGYWDDDYPIDSHDV